MEVLMSIKPKYVKPIFDKTKKYEFRKSIFQNKDVKNIFIYSTSPKKRIVGFFKVGEIIKKTPEELWEICQNLAGIDKTDFFKYFKDKKVAYAIKIENITRFNKEIDPIEIEPDFRPPQSYYYLKSNNFLSEIRKQVKIDDFFVN